MLLIYHWEMINKEFCIYSLYFNSMLGQKMWIQSRLLLWGIDLEYGLHSKL